MITFVESVKVAWILIGILTVSNYEALLKGPEFRLGLDLL